MYSVRQARGPAVHFVLDAGRYPHRALGRHHEAGLIRDDCHHSGSRIDELRAGVAVPRIDVTVHVLVRECTDLAGDLLVVDPASTAC